MKPWHTHFEYIPELKKMLKANPYVKFLWIDAGMFERGLWHSTGGDGGYTAVLTEILDTFPNLFISVSKRMLGICTTTEGELPTIIEKHPKKFMVTSSTMGYFSETYADEIRFVEQWTISNLSASLRKRVLFDNAFDFFKAVPNVGQRSMVQMKPAINWMENSTAVEQSAELPDLKEAEELDLEPPGEENVSLEGMVNGELVDDSQIKFVSIDTHLHMLDFLQKSSGTRSIMQAMDGCGCTKAVLIGMPCTKKWASCEPERPLHYLDDSSDCYFYSCESPLFPSLLFANRGCTVRISYSSLTPRICPT